MEYRVCSTGDQIWLADRFGQKTVVKIVTHDGLVWSEDEPILKRMDKLEGVIHKAEVFCLKLINKLLA